MRTFSVVGAGRAGRSIAKLMRRARWRVVALSCRSAASARSARRFVGAGRATTSNPAAVPGARVVVLGVPDRAIPSVWREILPVLRPGTLAFHLSGSESSGILQPVGPAKVGAVHPMKSFADPALAVRTFRGTYCGVEGPPELSSLVRSWGGIPLRIDPNSKALYHAAAVFATNYVVSLVDAAVEVLSAAGVPRRKALPAALSMARGTLDNLGHVGLPAALTGPIERGDAGTVQRHLDALAAADRKLLESYVSLGLRACKIARRKGTPGSAVGRIERLLTRR